MSFAVRTSQPALRSVRGASIAAVAALAATLSIGGSAAQDSGNALPTELFETATVRARPLDQATATVTVMNREEIERLDVATAAELIRFLPGVTLTGGSPRGGVASGQVRGGDPNFTVILLDGVPLNDATDQFGGSVNLSSLPTAHLERVELVRGPVSSSYGSSGLAGVIHLITRRGGDTTPKTSLSVGGGKASSRHAAASVSGSGSASSYFVGASWDQEEERVADDASDRFSLQGNVTTQIGSSSELAVSGRYASWSGTDYPEGSGGPRLGTGETRVSDHDEFSLALAWQSHPDRTGSGATSSRRGGHRVQASVFRHDLARVSPGVPILVPPSREDTEYTTLSLDWTLAILQTDKNRLSVGAEIESEDGQNVGALELPPMFGGLTDASYAIDRTTAGAFVEWVTSRGPVVFELGLRIDDPEGFDTEWSPRAGVAYRLSGGATRLRASVGRAFKLPSFFALASPAALGGNPDLKPEIALGADVGIERHFPGANVDASVTVFFNHFEDLVDFDFGSFMNVNLNEVHSEGVELALSWRPADDLEVHVSAMGQDVENRATGESLRHRPDVSGSVRLLWRASERVRGQVDGQWSSDMLDQQIPSASRDHVAGFALYGASVAVDLTPKLGLRARIDNLTDHAYETFIGFPGAGRSYRLSLHYTP